MFYSRREGPWPPIIAAAVTHKMTSPSTSSIVGTAVPGMTCAITSRTTHPVPMAQAYWDRPRRCPHPHTVAKVLIPHKRPSHQRLTQKPPTAHTNHGYRWKIEMGKWEIGREGGGLPMAVPVVVPGPAAATTPGTAAAAVMSPAPAAVASAA